jgi:hypothetical protein
MVLRTKFATMLYIRKNVPIWGFKAVDFKIEFNMKTLWNPAVEDRNKTGSQHTNRAPEQFEDIVPSRTFIFERAECYTKSKEKNS